MGVLFIASLDEHWLRMDGKSDRDEIRKAVDDNAKIWIVGCLIFFILGFL